MRISSAEIAFSAHHTLTRQHSVRETLTEIDAGMSRSGEAQAPAGRTIERTRERAAGQKSQPSLLDERLAGRTPEQLEALKTRQAMLRTPFAAEGGADLLQNVELLLSRMGGGTDIAAMLPAAKVEGETVPLSMEVSPQERVKIDLLVATIERLSGRRFTVLEPGELEPKAAEPPPAKDAAASARTAEQPAWGLHYTYEERLYEAETSTFSATGQVRTSDGEEIAVDVELTMSRQLVQENRMDVRLGALQDPLVVNFEGTAAELSQRRYAFDLDADGTEDQVRFVGPNSSFLALDRNGNGAVDDGSELFGPTSGNGFAELAAYDEDGNEWIDEGDSIYAQLRLWTHDQAGEAQLMALGQRGVGAIYLGNTATPFQVKDESGQLQAQVRSSGLYLNEDGTAGTMQQVDLVV